MSMADDVADLSGLYEIHMERLEQRRIEDRKLADALRSVAKKHNEPVELILPHDRPVIFVYNDIKYAVTEIVTRTVEHIPAITILGRVLHQVKEV